MKTINYTFEEIVLDVGTRAAPMRIALISGEAKISYARTYSDDYGKGWEIEGFESITLSGPISKDPEVVVEYPSPLWDHVVHSLDAYHHRIREAIGDDNQPDGDSLYEAAHDRRIGL